MIIFEALNHTLLQKIKYLLSFLLNSTLVMIQLIQNFDKWAVIAVLVEVGQMSPGKI